MQKFQEKTDILAHKVSCTEPLIKLRRYRVSGVFFFPALPISASPTLRPMLSQSCVVRRVSGSLNSR